MSVLCADRLYGGRSQITRGELTRDPGDDTILLDRRALHARKLALKHPVTGEPLELVAPLPEEFDQVLEVLREFRSL